MMVRSLACLLLLSAPFTLGCASSFIVKTPPKEPFDAVVVLGCPNEEDGSLSYCQLGRAGQAALVWRHGWAKTFIVSGGAVHTPYVEAEAIAQGMQALGVPADRIVLETEALHTDENVYFSMLLARRLGLEQIAVASVAGHAAWACKMMLGWGHACSALGMDTAELEAFMPPHEAELRAIRSARVPDWVPLDDREEAIYADTGRARLPSFLLYPLIAMGAGWTPRAPSNAPPVRWAEKIGAGSAATKAE